MTHLSLFSGIGGLDLAAEMAGFCTVGQVEIDDYCNRVLEHHWPGVPRWRDVKDVTAESFEERTGIKSGTLAVLSGGFPCQPFSVAGKRKGKADNRFLWPEMLRVICEIRPRWIVAENVRGILSIDTGRTFGRILTDLAQNGYRVGWLCYGAGDVGAPHKRERVFIVAYSMQLRHRGEDQERRSVDPPEGIPGINRQENRASGDFIGADIDRWAGIGNKYVADANNPGSRTPYGGTNENRQEEVKERGEQLQLRPCRFSQDVAHTPQHLFNRPRQTRETGRGEFADGGAGPTQSGLGRNFDEFPNGMDGYRWPAGPGPQHPWEPPRIATGVKDRVAKLKALGNAVVPAQAYPIFRAIMEIEEAIP